MQQHFKIAMETEKEGAFIFYVTANTEQEALAIAQRRYTAALTKTPCFLPGHAAKMRQLHKRALKHGAPPTFTVLKD